MFTYLGQNYLVRPLLERISLFFYIDLPLVLSKVLVYDGMNDIICNHPSIVAIFENMKTWEGKEEYKSAKTEVSKRGIR